MNKAQRKRKNVDKKRKRKRGKLIRSDYIDARRREAIEKAAKVEEVYNEDIETG